MAKIEHIKNKRGEVIYPVSKEGAIYDENGVLLSTKIATFITRLVDNLANYYLKSETYTKGEVDNLIGAIQGFTYIVVSELPTASAETMGIVYLVPSEDPQTQNVKDEYITIRSGVEGSYTYSWEQIGSTAIDLSGYVTTEALNTALADYTTTANLTTLLAAKQDTIADLSTIRSGAAAGATAYQKPGTGIPSTDMASGVQTSLGKADSAYQKPVGGIPKTDLESGVQESLELADSAVQADPIGSIVPPVDPSEFATKEEVEELEQKVGDGIVLESAVAVAYTRAGKKVPTSGDNRIIISNAGTDVVYYRVGFSTQFRAYGKCGTSATIITYSNGTGTGDSVSYTKVIERTTDDFNYIGTTPADKDYVVLTVNNNGDAYGCVLHEDRIENLEDAVDSIEDELDGLEKTFERTINGEKLTKTGDGYIDTNVGIGNTVTLTPAGTTDWGYYISPIAPGQEVVITGKGGSGGRLWAFLDADNKLLAISDSSLNASGLRIVAPDNSAKLVANNNFVDVPSPSFVIYSSDSIQERLDNTEYDTLLKVGNNERQPNGNGYFSTNVGIGNPVPTSPSSTSSSWRYYIVPVSYGQKVIVTGKGGSNSRLWAFVDKDNNLVSVSDGSLTAVGLSLNVPQNAVKIIVNNNYASFPVGSVSVTDANGNILDSIYPKLPTSRKINVLIIGNSFSFRSTGQSDASLGTLCVFAGLDAHIEIVGKSGASFDTLYGLFQNNTACEYHYENESNGTFTNLSGDGITIRDALEKYPWDYIVFHQASASSGDYSTFSPGLDNLIRSARTICTNEHIKVGLMETWAYADNNSTYPNATTGFDTQEEFYEAICDTYSQAVRDYDIDVLIPAGTAIQNARGTSLGTSFNDFALSASDDVHINPAGCVLTALAWFATIFGKEFHILIGSIPKFTSIYTDAEYETALACVQNAIKFPFETI